MLNNNIKVAKAVQAHEKEVRIIIKVANKYKESVEVSYRNNSAYIIPYIKLQIDKTAIKVKCGKACTSDKCNFLCKWFVQKNYYLFLELASLQEYLESLPDNYFKPKIEVVVNSSDKNKLSSKQFTLLKKYVDGR